MGVSCDIEGSRNRSVSARLECYCNQSLTPDTNTLYTQFGEHHFIMFQIYSILQEVNMMCLSVAKSMHDAKIGLLYKLGLSVYFLLKLHAYSTVVCFSQQRVPTKINNTDPLRLL